MFFGDLMQFLKSKAFLFCVAVIAFVTLMSGCSALYRITDETTDKVAPLIDKYCFEVDEQLRAQLRAEINAKTDGNIIHITCAGDSEQSAPKD